LVGLVDCDLVISGFGVKADEIHAATTTVTEVVESVVTTGNGILVRERDAVQRTKVDAESPDEVFDIFDVLLVGFGSEEAAA